MILLLQHLLSERCQCFHEAGVLLLCVRAAPSISLSRASLSLASKNNLKSSLQTTVCGWISRSSDRRTRAWSNWVSSKSGLKCRIMPSNSRRKDTLRVQVAVNASPNIMLLNIELVAPKLDLATHGIIARRSTERHRNHPMHRGPEERSEEALHGQRVAQQQVPHVHEETLDATELVELVCFPKH